MQIINNFLKLSLLFLLNLTLALADNDNLVVYDLSYMVNQGKYILPLPEIKIKFDELGEQFKAGDKLYIRMTSESEELSSPTWFYPIVHDKSEPITKRMLKYLTKLSLDARVDHIPFRGKIIPLPKLRIMSGDILGSARSKVSSVYQFEPENSEKLEIDFLKDIEQNDLLRLNGLFLGVSEHREISKTSFEYRRNNGNWSPLNIYNILVGSTKISSIGETRLLRLKNHEYDLSVALETGKYSSLRGGDKLKLKLSDSFNCEWVNSGPQTIRVEFEPEVDSFKVVPVIIGKEINFQVKNGNYDKARLTFPDLKVRCLSSDSELLSSGSISLYSDLSSTELFEDKDQYLTLGNISEPISLMNPRMKLVGGDFRSFYRTDTTCMVDLLVNLEKGSILYPGDTIKIILPEIYSIRWDYVVAENPNLFKVININQKTLGVIIQEKVINTLNLNSLAIALPHKSIPPFNLKVVYPFLKSNHEQLVQNDLRFGHIDIKLAESQMLNTAGKKAHLKRITVQEDSIGKILRRGDVIEVIGRQDAFDFDLEKLNEIIILDNSESNVTKIAINYSSCTESKIVFNILIPFELGEEIFIDNIPVYNLQNFVKNVHLTYRINTGNIYSDINQVNLIRANAKFENENKFIRDVNAKPQILALQNLNINLVNIPNYINGGQFLALRLPREFFRWAANQNPILKPSDLFTVEYFSDDELVISTK
nr:hypothetical protein [Candidatus Brocadiales bacterium]